MVERRILALLLFFTWWDVLCGQVHRRLEEAGERTVPVLFPETGTVPTRIIPTDEASRDPQVATLDLDSLELSLLDIEIQKAEERVKETSFWKRIIPQIHASGSFGVREIVFIDPATFTPYILPRDAYRLTISLSLSEVLNFSKHSLTELELGKLSTERTYRTLRKAQLRKSIEQQLTVLQEQLGILREEVGIVQELLRFNQLRFEQGKIEFDTLLRTKLELLNTQKAVQRIQHQQSELRLKLSQGDVQ